ncbi:MAG: hypothetical protein JW731_05515 [Bacteroidales bacterium]|nr:hypothetical protein [Bacteroidales bacterium]
MNQKDEELVVMEYFRKNYPEFPAGRLIPSESPDFILKINSKKSIGIELTRLDNMAKTLPEKIQSTLNNKNDKLRIYQNGKFQSIWLIIYADFLEESKNFNIQNKMDNWRLSSQFDRVYLFELFYKNILELLIYS